ncbi:unnamed protein product, partial [Musa textilis]
ASKSSGIILRWNLSFVPDKLEQVPFFFSVPETSIEAQDLTKLAWKLTRGMSTLEARLTFSGLTIFQAPKTISSQHCNKASFTNLCKTQLRPWPIIAYQIVSDNRGKI